MGVGVVLVSMNNNKRSWPRFLIRIGQYYFTKLPHAIKEFDSSKESKLAIGTFGSDENSYKETRTLSKPPTSEDKIKGDTKGATTL